MYKITSAHIMPFGFFRLKLLGACWYEETTPDVPCTSRLHFGWYNVGTKVMAWK